MALTETPCRILHLILDDPKFVGLAIRFFDSSHFTNSWVRISEDRKPVDLSPTTEIQHLVVHDYHDNVVVQGQLHDMATRHDIVMFHFLVPNSLGIVRDLAKRTTVVIQYWGGDYSHRLIPNEQIVLPLTASYIHSKSFPFLGFKRMLFFIKRRLKNMLSTGTFSLLPELRYAHAYMTLLPEENWNFPIKTKCKHLPARIVYIDIDKPCEKHQMESPTTYRVLLGNSATSTNNHLDIIDDLAAIKPQILEVILPLNYGDSKYGDHIQKEYEAKFGSIARPLRTFIDSDNYDVLLNQVDIVIMNQLRQQALGNIVRALSQGKTVYLHPQGVNYRHFVTAGIHVKSTATLRQGMALITHDQAQDNMKLVRQLWDIHLAQEVLHKSLTKLTRNHD